MANTQIDITTNGTTTLATAGKYCDRNIDVNVAISSEEEATVFTNVLKHESTVITLNSIAYVGGNTSTVNGMILVDIDLVELGITMHPAELTFRWRGMSVNGSYRGMFISTDKTTWSNTLDLNMAVLDEHGDFSIYKKINYPSTNRYLRMMFVRKENSVSITEDDIAGCILTINETIGNGGYVG